MSVLPDGVARYLDAASAEPEPILREMEQYGREQGFPIVGPVVGRYLRGLARTAGARRVFEFGSGFGYSAAWFAGALPGDGEVVLTEIDADELDEAREFLDRAGHADLARFEHGDALEIFPASDGRFDLVLLDHDKKRYPEGFDLVRDRLTERGMVVADNMMYGPVEFDEVLACLEGTAEPGDDRTAGVVEYVETVRDDPDFETSLLPLGSGIAVSVRK